MTNNFFVICKFNLTCSLAASFESELPLRLYPWDLCGREMCDAYGEEGRSMPTSFISPLLVPFSSTGRPSIFSPPPAPRRRLYTRRDGQNMRPLRAGVRRQRGRGEPESPPFAASPLCVPVPLLPFLPCFDPGSKLLFTSWPASQPHACVPRQAGSMPADCLVDLPPAVGQGGVGRRVAIGRWAAPFSPPLLTAPGGN